MAWDFQVPRFAGGQRVTPLAIGPRGLPISKHLLQHVGAIIKSFLLDFLRGHLLRFEEPRRSSWDCNRSFGRYILQDVWSRMYPLLPGSGCEAVHTSFYGSRLRNLAD